MTNCGEFQGKQISPLLCEMTNINNIGRTTSFIEDLYARYALPWTWVSRPRDSALLTAQPTFVPPVCTQIPADHAHPTPAEITQIKERAAADPSVLVSAEPMENIGTLRYRVRDYAQCKGDGGCYWADLDAQYQRAAQLLVQSAGTRKRGEKLALVLDIDETSLSSYCEMQREDFGFIARSFNEWIVSGDAATPIQGTLRLVRQARELGIDLFFITGRPEPQREATERNLHSAGFESWKHLSLRPSSSGQIEHNSSTTQYKSWKERRLSRRDIA